MIDRDDDHKHGIRRTAGVLGVPHLTTSRGNAPTATSDAVKHAVAFVNRHGSVDARRYFESTGMSYRGALQRLWTAADAGLIQATGEGASVVFSRIEEVTDAG